MRAAEFLTDAYYNKNHHYADDRSINPATGKPYLQFGPTGPIDPNDWAAIRHRDEILRNQPTLHYGVYPSYKIAMRSLKGREDKLKIVRAGVSKFKIVPRSDPAPELFGE